LYLTTIYTSRRASSILLDKFDQFAYITGDEDNAIEIIEIEDIYNPRTLAFVNSREYAIGIAVTDDGCYAYVTD